MTSFLLVAPPLTGHVNPLVGVARSLERAGHETAWAGSPEVIHRLAGPQARVHPVAVPAPSAERPPQLRGFAALQYLWEEVFVPLADAGVDDVSAAVRAFEPDVVVADQQTLAGPLAALRAGLPWVTSASTSAEFSDQLVATPKILQWRRDLLADLVRRHVPGCSDPLPDLYLSPELVLLYSCAALVRAELPAQVRLIGSSLGGRPTPGEFPWPRLRSDRPLVYCTLGTVSTGAADRFLAECAAAAALITRPVQFVVADPGGVLTGGYGDDVIVVPHAPQLELLARADAVICHGGHNTVCESLSQGVPLVLAPIRDDQPVIAQQVVDAGAGLRVRFARAGAAHVAAAVQEVLDDPRFTAAARQVQASLLEAGDGERTVRLLEDVARPRSMTTRPLTILFMPESAYGPTNQCIGLGDVLLRRGHRVVFAAEASWRGKLEALGFEEDLVDLAPPPDDTNDTDGPGDPGQFWKDFIRETAPEFRKPTHLQLETFMKPTWQALIEGAQFCEAHLKAIIERVRPDVIVEDNVVCFPALTTAAAPFVRIVSCNPLELPGPGIPPPYSGLPAADPAQWPSFRAEYDRTHRPVWQAFNDWVVAQGADPLPDLQFMPTSKHANLYVFPQEADYLEGRPLDHTWHRMDSSVRETDAVYELPPLLSRRPEGSALIYLSLGSLGSADVELMRRLVAVLARTPHRYVVSTGPQQAEYDLAANMVGAEFLPQTTIVPQVDVVITHGGNNTTTEALHFGKPMVLLPLFWDQYDNAQRMHETGFGVRLPTYDFTDDQLQEALATVLHPEFRARLDAVGEQVRARDGLHRGADVIEQVARRHADG